MWPTLRLVEKSIRTQLLSFGDKFQFEGASRRTLENTLPPYIVSPRCYLLQKVQSHCNIRTHNS